MFADIYSVRPVTDFSKLYAKYAADIYRFALGLSGDRAVAEDITSETFVRAWTVSGEIRLATVKAFLFTIARNLFLQGLRKKKRQTHLEEDFPDPRPSPEGSAEQRSELRAVLEGLQRLPELDRAALLMRVQEEMPYEEIAGALNLSVTAVKVKVHRARLKLSECRVSGARSHSV